MRLRNAARDLVREVDQLARVEGALVVLERQRAEEIREVERRYVGPLRELRAQERQLRRRRADARGEVLLAAREEER